MAKTQHVVYWLVSTSPLVSNESPDPLTLAVLPDDGKDPPTAGRIEWIAAHMDSLGAYTQAREIRRLGRAFLLQRATQEPHCSKFDDMGLMLKFCEELRRRRREGEPISYIGSSSELDESIGESGVEGPPPDYNWKKRRP
jgi:hypothetical protein